MDLTNLMTVDMGGHLFVTLAAKWPASGSGGGDDDDDGDGRISEGIRSLSWIDRKVCRLFNLVITDHVYVCFLSIALSSTSR